MLLCPVTVASTGLEGIGEQPALVVVGGGSPPDVAHEVAAHLERLAPPDPGGVAVHGHDVTTGLEAQLLSLIHI